MNLMGIECMWCSQIFVEYYNCCQGARVDVERSSKSFLAAVQMGHESGLETVWAVGMQRSNWLEKYLAIVSTGPLRQICLWHGL